MKFVARILIALCVVCIAISLCACGGKNVASVSEIGGSKIVKGAEFQCTLDEGCKESFRLRFFVTDTFDPSMGSAGIYMQDLDSGIMYDESFLDWDQMVRGDGWNLDTREVALMVFFNDYCCNMDADFLWSDAFPLIHYSQNELEQLSAQLSFAGNSAPVDVTLPDDSAEEIPEPMHGDFESYEELSELTIDADYVYEQAKLLNIQLKQAYRYYFELGEGPVLNLLVLQSTEFDGFPVVSFGGKGQELGVYLLDMDTDTWYDTSFIDEDVMVVNGKANLADKDAALMCALNTFNMTGEKDFIFADYDQLVKLDDETLGEINQKLLFEQLTRKVPAYPYNSVDEEPRQLSDEEIAALVHRPAGYVKSVISTVPDAIAYLDMRFPTLYHGMPLRSDPTSNEYWLRSAPEILTEYTYPAARSCVTTCVSYLLEDNYEVESLVGFWPSAEKMNEDGPQKAINYIKTATGYIFFDPVLRMQGDAMSRKGALLPQTNCSSVAEYIEIIRQTPALADVLKYIFSNAGGVRMSYQVDYTNGYTVTTETEGIEMVYYSVPAADPSANIKPESIHSYQLSSMLGGVTLTVEDAYALVDAAPEVVREKVKTAADVLMYMLAAKTADSHGCKCTDVGGYTWHWNMSAKEVMENHLGNCGSCANLANYLLDGDYEEVGYVDQAYYPDEGGSHVYTYVRHQGKYYILDYSWYIFAGYNVLEDYPVTVLDSLEQWPDKAQQVYGRVCLVMAYDTPGMQYPVIFGEDYESQFGSVYYILPEGAEYTVLYEADDGYQYHHIPFDISAYNWNVFW